MSATPQLDYSKTQPLFGQVLDADGHCYIEPSIMRELVGGVGAGPMQAFLDDYVRSEEHRTNRAKNIEGLWSVKGISALGATDPHERVKALDLMGMKSQLVFSNTFGCELRIHSAAARQANSRVNDYYLEWSRATAGRARPAIAINMSEVDWACSELERVIKAGAKVVTLPTALPPAGVSPAHEKWDRFWAILQEADVVATLHLASGGLMASADPDPMLPQREWGDAASLRGAPVARPGGEEAISPYFMLVAHISPEIFLQTLVMGGVFERFPRLRFGVIEYGANWVGPCVERMDLWVEFMGKIGRTYPMKPSEYVIRNVRVTPFWHENLARMIERYGLEAVYCFSTDYPHLEGSRDPIGKFDKWLDRLPAAYKKRFLIDNAKLLFPGE